ncbi:dihydrofolate reductase [Paenibacillus yanchengensis]|uniref:Dihydrofolate reductase n=1 Tax=Paenibacillus yanchengensis TaxID=2035833 RepID=A0ABW4YQB5_9BACL
MAITMIAAMDENRVIGVENRLPWRLPAEMAFFKQTTIGKTVIMGRKTAESLPKALVERRNVVLTKQAKVAEAGFEYIHSVDEALQLATTVEELVVIGGAEIYKLFLPHANRIYLTTVHTEVADGDAHFPVLMEKQWQLTEEQHCEQDEKNKFSFTVRTYNRISN